MTVRYDQCPSHATALAHTATMSGSAERFGRIAGGAADAVISFEAFVADMVQRDMEPSAAGVLFRAAAMDRRAVHLTAYVAAVHMLRQGKQAPATDAEIGALQRLYAGSSARDLIRDLSSGEAHVRWLMHAVLGAADVDGASSVAARELLQADGILLTRMRALGLEPGAVLRAQGRRRRRVVLDGRTARAHFAPVVSSPPGAAAMDASQGPVPESQSRPARAGGGRPSAGASPDLLHESFSIGAAAPVKGLHPFGAHPEAAAHNSGSVFGGGVSGPALRPPQAAHVSSERVDDVHLGRGLVVEADLVTTARWRGPLAPARGSRPFTLAQRP